MTTISEVVGLDIRSDDLLRFVEANQPWPVMFRAVVRRRRQSDQRALPERLDMLSRLAMVPGADHRGRRGKRRWLGHRGHDFAARYGQPVGASRDAVAIALRELRERKLVTGGRQRIALHDLKALRRIALG